MTMILRDAQPADKAAWLTLWQDYLTYYDVTLPAGVTEATWARIIDPDHRLACRLAVEGDRVLGFATHHNHCSTWVAGEDCYLEDLFVAKASRGKGVGRSLIEDLMAIARTKGWHRVYWHTDETNTTARKLYDSFTQSDGHIRYRVVL